LAKIGIKVDHGVSRQILLEHLLVGKYFSGQKVLAAMSLIQLFRIFTALPTSH